jgi:hypothetical protein
VTAGKSAEDPYTHVVTVKGRTIRFSYKVTPGHYVFESENPKVKGAGKRQEYAWAAFQRALRDAIL